MVAERTEEKIRVKRERAKQAIDLAMASKWDEAIAVNRAILSDFHDDIEALNRLGKALSETGKLGEARECFNKVLAHSPGNSIAKKNLERLGLVKQSKAVAKTQQTRVPPSFFIEETGKTGVTTLMDKAAAGILAQISAGEQVTLERDGNRLTVTNANGEYLGTVNPKIGLRLVNMMKGGNRYAAAIAGITGQEIKVFIKESYQHPNLRGKPSFSRKGMEEIRPFMLENDSRSDEDDAAEFGTAENWKSDLREEIEEVAAIARTARRMHADDETE
ncbi:MAG: tetratricopeptide repeat protein [Chloroflexi bacterium]|nr:tetratricopeptide repeat protein [Chloroflexota bacterium]